MCHLTPSPAFSYLASLNNATGPALLSYETARLFSTEADHSQSSRALGWNTNDPGVFDQGWNLSCGALSASTFMHLGYTGTQLCIDPVRCDPGPVRGCARCALTRARARRGGGRNVFTMLFTNRVFPTDQNIKIRRVRQLFNDAVVAALDAVGPARPAAAHAPDRASHAPA